MAVTKGVLEGGRPRPNRKRATQPSTPATEMGPVVTVSSSCISRSLFVGPSVELGALIRLMSSTSVSVCSELGGGGGMLPVVAFWDRLC